jgi:hypothetical protein
MPLMPAELKLTADEEMRLAAIRIAARDAHDLARRQAARRGRKDFPAAPYECSWAYEEQFRRQARAGR